MLSPSKESRLALPIRHRQQHAISVQRIARRAIPLGISPGGKERQSGSASTAPPVLRFPRFSLLLPTLVQKSNDPPSPLGSQVNPQATWSKPNLPSKTVDTSSDPYLQEISRHLAPDRPSRAAPTMKLLAAGTLLAGLVGVCVAQAQSCPTATRTVQNRACGVECPFTDCNFTTTLRNPCGCPASIPTATLAVPCEASCPYQGCGIEFRTTSLTCARTTSSTRRQIPPTTTTTVRPTTTQQTRVITSVVVLPPATTSTPCPTITRTTSPADCAALRCPVPTCQVRTTMAVPCGCNPKTLLFVQGCATECASGCLTRTETVSATRC